MNAGAIGALLTAFFVAGFFVAKLSGTDGTAELHACCAKSAEIAERAKHNAELAEQLATRCLEVARQLRDQP